MLSLTSEFKYNAPRFISDYGNSKNHLKCAFYRVSELYSLPKFCQDKNSTSVDDPRSVLEEMAIVKYIFLEDELKGVVMLALFNVYKKRYIPIEEAAARYYGGYEKIPKEYYIYYFGKDVDARIEFELNEQTWKEAGAIKMVKIVQLN